MSEDYIDWDVSVDPGRAIPEWMWKTPFKVRFFRSAIEEAGGPIGPSEGLEDAFNYARSKLEIAANRKIAAVQGEFDQPLAIVAQDVLP